MSTTHKKIEPFGTLLGYAPGNVGVYSSDYDTATDEEYPKRSAYRSYTDGIYMGYKWQCVEFARRWMYLNKGYIFDDVAMAYDIFHLRSVRDVKVNTLLPLKAFSNGNKRHPVEGSLLIWNEGGDFERTGHVAIITQVTDSYVRIAEQNVDHALWPAGRNYSRELKAKVTADGEYWLSCSYGNAEILGWMIQTEDDTFAEPTEEINPLLHAIQSHRAENPPAKKAWLNIANSDEAAFVEAMGGHHLTLEEAEKNQYFILSHTAQLSLEHASNDLHSMFMHATEYVLANEELLDKFNLPKAILPKIRQSWDNRLNEVITSRFDFGLTPQGLKVYEYNCDSAACYMEAAKIQGLWFKNNHIVNGEDAGKHLFKSLVRAWQKSSAKGVVHILRDDDIFEEYHAYFMQEAIAGAGIDSKIIVGLTDLAWNQNGEVVDKDGDKVQWVWKTWAWETALDQIRQECETEAIKEKGYEPQWQQHKPLNLSDVLFHKDVMVYEPLWSLIPSNKAILPVLWSMFPNHPFLLNAAFELSDDLKEQSYVVKPIVGRCGSNISLFDKNHQLMEQTSGNFDSQDKIYQQFFALPCIDGLYTQVSTFMTSGIYAGSGVRVDRSRVINDKSDCLPLLFVNDKEFLSDK